MSQIKTKKWGECYKRIILVDSDDNVGVGESPSRIVDGDGNQTALMVGTDAVGIYQDKKLIFGYDDVYIKLQSTGTLKIGAERVILPNKINVGAVVADSVSTTNIRCDKMLNIPSASFGEIKANVANFDNYVFDKVDAGVITGCSVNIIGKATIKSLSVEKGLESFMSWDE